MTVGEWLDSVSSSQGGRLEPAKQRPDPTGSQALETLDRKLEELNLRLKRLSDTPKPPIRERRPERDHVYSTRRTGRDRLSEDRGRRSESLREPDLDPVAARLDQIDRKLSEIAQAPREPERDHREPAGAPRAERPSNSDVDRLRQGLREIERLQSTLIEGINERGSRTGQALERHLQEERERGSRHTSAVAETISRLEAEIRSLRQTVENRVEPAQPGIDESLMQDIRRMLARVADASPSRQDAAHVDRLFDEMNRLRDLVVETGNKAYIANSVKSTQEARLADMVERLASVATAAQEKTSDDMRTLERRLADVGERMAEIEGRGASAADIADLQRVINAITAKIDRLAARPVVPAEFSNIDIRLEKLTEKLDRLGQPQKLVVPAGLIDLDIRIEKLGDKLDRFEPNVGNPRQLAGLEAEISALRLDLAQNSGTHGTSKLEGQIGALSERIDLLAKVTASSKPVIPAGLVGLDIRIDKLGEKLDRLEPNPVNSRQIAGLETEISALRLDLAQSSGSGGTAKLESQISALSGRIDLLAKATASFKPVNLEKVEARFGDLVDMLDRMVGSEASIDRNIDALQGEVAAIRRDLSGLGAATRNPELEDQVRRLTQRLESAGSQNPDPRILANIEEKIVKLGELIITDVPKPTDTTAIERKLAKLETLLADRHEDALEAASAAAREAVREFATFAAEARASDTGVHQLAENLRKMQESSRTTEVRTTDALQSVHDALTTIVDRLGAIERSGSERVPDNRAAPEPATAGRDYAQRAPSIRPPLAQMPAEVAPTEARLASDDDRTAPVAPPTYRADPQLSNPEDHRPLEPGSGKPRVAPGMAGAFAGYGPTGAPGARMAPTQRPQAEAAGQVAQPSATEGEGPRRNDFIAAARRAAQAASQPIPGAPPIPGDRLRPEMIQEIGSDAAAKQAKTSLFASLFKGRQKILIIAIAGLLVTVAMMNAVRWTLSRMAPAEPAPAVSLNLPADGQTPSTAAASLALAPPSSVTSTFTAPAPTDAAARQAALANAMQQAAAAQGYKPPATAIGTTAKSPDSTSSVRQPATAVASQQMPPPIGTSPVDGSGSDQMTTQSIGQGTPQAIDTGASVPAAGQPLPLAAEKIGSLALRTAAANGDPKAQFEIGMRYSEGHGLAPDMHEAAIWFERAASHSFQPAAYRLGSAYEKGLGVDRDATEAKRWYRIASEGGNVRAMHNLGVMYANDRDMPAALPWFQKAADAGLKDSQFNLGIIYALGSGVKQDLAVSYKWFALGAAQGDTEAVKKRDDIATHLDHTALAAAKMAVSTWRPAQISREANEETAVWSEPAPAAQTKPSAAASPGSLSAALAAPPTGASGSAVSAPPNGWTKLMQAQAALQGKGFYTGKIDGEMSPDTKAAIKAFQKKAGLKQTGEVDSAFMSAVLAKQL